jgi:PKD repeat protein
MRNLYRFVCLSLLILVGFSLNVKAQTVDFVSTITQNGCQLATYGFVATYTGPTNPPALHYHWDFGNSTTSGAQPTLGLNTTSRAYIAPGVYDVLLRVYDGPSFGSNLLASKTNQVIVYTNIIPTFSGLPLNGCIPQQVDFIDETVYNSPIVGAVDRRVWNFGDGNTVTVGAPTATVSHIYTVPGTYQVTLTVYTKAGPIEECAGTRVRTSYVQIRHKPVANFTVAPTPPPCNLPYTASFTNTSSIASTPPPAGSISLYEWTFFDTDGTTILGTSTNTNPTFNYNAFGTYPVQLRVTSSTGCVDTYTNANAVVLTNPIADFNPLTPSSCTNASVIFNDNSTAGASSYSWNFGSGATPSTATGTSPSVTFTTAGLRNVTLTVTYPNGCVRTVVKPYNVISAPVADFSNSPVGVYCSIPQTVNFTPLFADNVNYSYVWNFGETNNVGVNPGPISTLYNPTNVFDLYGTYNVSFTVTDNTTGCSNTITKVLTITEPIAAMNVLSINNFGCQPLTINFGLAGSATEGISRYLIDFDGDGTAEIDVQSPPQPFPLNIPATVSHTYTVGGTFNPTFEIRTPSGCVRKVNADRSIFVGAPLTITGAGISGAGANGCTGLTTVTPTFGAGPVADSIVVDFGGGVTVADASPPFNASNTYDATGTKNYSVIAYYNGCPMSTAFSGSFNITGPYASLNVLAPNLCSGATTANFTTAGTSGSTSGVTTYTIDYGDGTTPVSNTNVTVLNGPHTFANPGTYNVTLTATDGTCTSSSAQVVTISVAATASFTTSTTPVCAINGVDFTSTSTSLAPGIVITNYQWDFGDGNVTAFLAAPGGATINHVYVPSLTPYLPKLKVRLSNGCEYDSPTGSVTVHGPIPTIVGAPTILTCAGSTVNFAGNATIIPSGAITNWNWGFGDPASGIFNIANGQNATHIFNNAGTYTVTLTVKDDNTLQSGSPTTPGCEASTTVQVIVSPLPNVSFTAPTACVTNTVNFTSTTNAVLPATYLWNFGNGDTSTSPNPTYTYASVTPGTSQTFPVSLTVTSANGCVRTVTQNVTVNNLQVVVQARSAAGTFSSSPLTLDCPPKTGFFTAVVSPAPANLASWQFNWQFGDGNQANTQNASNEYVIPNAPGIFNIVLTATNPATGCVYTQTLNNFVTVDGPRGTFDFLPKDLCKPDNVTFTANNLQGNPVSIEWDYGDGTTSGIIALPGGATSTHNYTISGSFLPIMNLYNSTNCKVGYASTVGRVDVSGKPNADFSWTGGGQICRDILVNFVDLSTPDPLTGPALTPQINRWNWVIYNGPTATDPVLVSTNPTMAAGPGFQNTSYTFTSAGQYMVELNVLTAFNQGGTPDGCPARVRKVITIVNPTINITSINIAPPVKCPNEIVTFTGAATTSVTPNTLVYGWRFFQSVGGPPAADTTGTLMGTASGPIVTFTFPTPGSYIAKLTVIDVALCTGGAVATTPVVIEPFPTFAPSSGPANQTVCEGTNSSFSFTASASDAATGFTYRWQANDGSGWVDVVNGMGGGTFTNISGTSVPPNATYTMSITNTPFALDNYQFRAVITRNNSAACTSTSSIAILNVDQLPTTANAGPNQIVCNQTSVTMAANTPTVGTGVWTYVSGPLPYSITNANSPTTTINLSNGSYVFRWSVTNGVCTTSTDDVQIDNGIVANAGTTQNLCNVTSAVLSANNPAPYGGTGTWSFVSGPSTLTGANFSSTSSPTATVSGLVTDATTPYILRWSITGVLGCPNSTADVQIFNRPLPVIASNPTPQTVCVGQSATFTATVSPALQLNWQVDLGGGGGFIDLADDATYSGSLTNTLTVSNIPFAFDTYKFRIRATNASTGCTSFSNQTELRVFLAPANTVNVSSNSVCQGTSVVFEVTNTQVGYTYELRNGVTPVAGTTALVGNGSTQSFTAFAPTTSSTNYNVLVTTPQANSVSCQQALPNLTVNVSPTPTTSAAGPNRIVCLANSTLQANAAVVGTGQWVLISGAGTITTASNPNSAVTALGVGANVFEWRITSGICPVSTSQMTITRISVGNTANAGLDQNICVDNTTLTANTPINGGTGLWTTTSTAVITNPTSPTTTVTGLSAGNNTFTWTITDACGSSNDAVIVRVETTPTVASVGATIDVCGTATATLSANTAVVGTGTWTVQSGSGIFTNASSPTTTVSGLSLGANVFRWTIANSCASTFADQTVTRNPTATAANAGTPFSTCLATANLNASTPVGGTGNWTVTAGGGVITTPSSPTSGVTGLTVGANTFVWTVTDVCGTSTTSTVTITRDAPPSTALAGSDIEVCNADVVTLAGNNPTSGTGFWVAISGGATITNPTQFNTGVTNLGPGANIFEWTVSNSCGTSSDQVTVLRYIVPIADAGVDQTLCGTSTILNGNIPTGTSTGQWTLVSGSGTFANATLYNTAVTGLSIGANVFRWTVFNGPTCVTNSDEVTVIRETNSTFAYAGPNVVQCGATVTLTANTPDPTTNFYWTLAPGTTLTAGTLGVNGGANGTPTITVSGLILGSNVFTWTVKNTCATSVSNVDITRIDNTTPANAGTDQTICADATTLAGNTPTNGTGTWTVVTQPVGGTANIVGANTANATLNGLSVAGNYTLRWTITNGACSTQQDEVVITRLSAPTVSNAGVAQAICVNSATLAGNAPTSGTGNWTVVSQPAGANATFANASLNNTTVSNLNVTGVYVLQWSIGNGVCTPSVSTVNREYYYYGGKYAFSRHRNLDTGRCHTCRSELCFS